MAAQDDESREVLFEFRQVGTAVRVAAIDAATGTEVTIMGPATASRNDLQRLALSKLKARLAAKG
jgi:translation initiation factor 1 (eIF-1/SUI1)